MPKSEDLLRPMFNMCRLTTDYKFYLLTMKKLQLLLALLIGGATVSFAQDAGETTRNAVCLTLTSGDTEYVAFTTNPKITTSEGNLIVTDTENNKTTLSKSLSEIASITAVYHDFSSTNGLNGLTQETGKTVEAVYDLAGRKVSAVQPGKVYILKYTDGSTTKAIK